MIANIKKESCLYSAERNSELWLAGLCSHPHGSENTLPMSDYNSSLSRRNILATTAAASFVGMAGCSGTDDDDDGAENERTDEEADLSDETSETEEAENEDEADEPTNELELLHAWSTGDGKAAIEALIEGFQEQHPEVELAEESVDASFPDDYNQAVLEKLQGNNPPSTFQAWPGKTLEIFDGAFEDIEEEVWDADLKNNYPSELQELAQHGGRYVTVPVNIHRINNLYYNTSVVEEADVNPETFEVPSDVVDACAKIEEETSAVPFAHQTNSAWSTIQLWETILLGQAGIDGYEAFINGNSTPNQVESALRAIVDLTEYYPRDASSMTFTEANRMVIDGEAAFIHQGDWVAAANSESDNTSSGEEWNYGGVDNFNYGEDWNHVAYPGTAGSYILNMDSFPYVADNPSPVATRMFLRYSGNPEGQVLFNGPKGSIPPRSDADVSSLDTHQQDQFEDYNAADNLVPSIHHGLAASGDVETAIDAAFNRFIERYDVTDTRDSLISASN